MMSGIRQHWVKLLLVSSLHAGLLGCGTSSEATPAPEPAGSGEGAPKPVSNGAAPAAEGDTGTPLRFVATPYSDGYCTRIDLAGERRQDNLIDSCRGWSIEGCRTLILASQPGIRADGALVVIGGRRISVPDAINAAVAREFGAGMAWLHLDLRPASCLHGRFSIPFEGTFMPKGVDGAAESMRGTAVVGEDGGIAVSVKRV